MSQKAGARHNKRDREIITNWHKRADELKSDMQELGAEIEELQEEAAKGDDLPASDPAPVIFGAVKAAGDGWTLDVLGVPFGGPHNGKDSHGEFFSAQTKIHERQFPNPLTVYYHGYTPEGRPEGEPVIIATAKYSHMDSRGHWYKVALDRAVAYAAKVRDAALKGLARASSGTVAHLKRVGSDGHILNWPVVELSLFDTDGRRQPANAYAVALPALKANYERAGLSLPAELEGGEAEPQADARGVNDPADAAPGQPASSTPDRKGILDMTPEELAALLDKRDADKKAAEDAERERQEKEQTRIQDAIKAERAKWEAEAAKRNRLPIGEPGPHQARWGDTRKYDTLSAADLAFMVSMLGNTKHGAPQSALKALGVKTAEDQGEAGHYGREALKALGVEPDDLKSAAKSDELDYTTQAGYGDEFVPTVWSAESWALVRAQRAILNKLPSRDYTGPGDTFTLPVEGADPTFYYIAQTTDIDSTTRRPNASIGDSKVATANQSLTFRKVGARVLYTGEMTEDSIIPWVAEVREKTTNAFGESMEHVVIDGDTEESATTNINHIGGTPTVTGTKRDLFLAANGFRKLALVTNTANSYDANNTFSDTLFLEVAKLLGTAGLNADPMKADFIIDANVFWAAQTIASVKTRDVFLNATLENGMFNGIWGYKVHTSHFMHWRSTTNPRKANTAGKVDLTTQSNNTRGAVLMVRWDQWLLARKRAMTMKLQDIPDSDAQQLIVTARIGLVYRDTEASAIAYDVAV